MRKKKMRGWCSSCGNEYKSPLECAICMCETVQDYVVKRPRHWEPLEE